MQGHTEIETHKHSHRQTYLYTDMQTENDKSAGQQRCVSMDMHTQIRSKQRNTVSSKDHSTSRAAAATANMSQFVPFILFHCCFVFSPLQIAGVAHLCPSMRRLPGPTTASCSNGSLPRAVRKSRSSRSLRKRCFLNVPLLVLCCAFIFTIPTTTTRIYCLLTTHT